MNCHVCRGLMPKDCPSCGVVELKPSNNNFIDIPEEDILRELLRSPGEPIYDWGYDYYPGCYEG